MYVKFIFVAMIYCIYFTFKIRQILPEHLNIATQQYETCEKLLSTSPLVTVTCYSGTERDIDIDITRNPVNGKFVKVLCQKLY